MNLTMLGIRNALVTEFYKCQKYFCDAKIYRSEKNFIIMRKRSILMENS